MRFWEGAGGGKVAQPLPVFSGTFRIFSDLFTASGHEAFRSLRPLTRCNLGRGAQPSEPIYCVRARLASRGSSRLIAAHRGSDIYNSSPGTPQATISGNQTMKLIHLLV